MHGHNIQRPHSTENVTNPNVKTHVQNLFQLTDNLDCVSTTLPSQQSDLHTFPSLWVQPIGCGRPNRIHSSGICAVQSSRRKAFSLCFSFFSICLLLPFSFFLLSFPLLTRIVHCFSFCFLTVFSAPFPVLTFSIFHYFSIIFCFFMFSLFLHVFTVFPFCFPCFPFSFFSSFLCFLCFSFPPLPLPTSFSPFSFFFHMFIVFLLLQCFSIFVVRFFHCSLFPFSFFFSLFTFSFFFHAFSFFISNIFPFRLFSFSPFLFSPCLFCFSILFPFSNMFPSSLFPYPFPSPFFPSAL